MKVEEEVKRGEESERGWKMFKKVKEWGRERKERQKREKQCGREVQVVGNESTWLSKPLSDDDLSWNKKKKKMSSISRRSVLSTGGKLFFFFSLLFFPACDLGCGRWGSLALSGDSWCTVLFLRLGTSWVRPAPVCFRASYSETLHHIRTSVWQGLRRICGPVNKYFWEWW